MESAYKIEVEVSYARPDVQVVLPVKVNADATVEEVIRLSGVLEQFPDIDLAVNKVGVFGKLSKLTAQLQPGDRVEIYRTLIADPKESRRQRAAADGKETPKPAAQENPG
jgi:putative ubiquitin-RnfH superfamily antitoxin RatB of RatAB toxin-antitoxin module